jgi:hypothetical protein
VPSVSAKQKKFMDAAAHNPAFARASGVPVKVAKEFSEKSKGMKFGKGADTSRADLQKVNKPKTLHGKMSIMKEGGDTMATKMKKMAAGGSAGNGITTAKMGAVRTAAPSRDGLAAKGKTKGTMVKMSGSKPLGMKKGGKAC